MKIVITYKICTRCIVTQELDTDAEYNVLKSDRYNGRVRRFKTDRFLEACKDCRDVYGKHSNFRRIEEMYELSEKYYAEMARHFADFGD